MLWPVRVKGVAMPIIALVDDDHNILTSVSIALEAEGYHITTYSDGVSALDGFKTTPPDLAILDIKMPRMDGMETLRRLRQKSDLPVIFLTSKDEQIDELFGLKMGADEFIRKPFSQRCWSSGSRLYCVAPRQGTVPRRRMPATKFWSVDCCVSTRNVTPALGKTRRWRSPSPNFSSYRRWQAARES